jgi:hypothetical protein
MDAIYAKYEPLITFAESRLRPENVLSVRRAYQRHPEYQGVGDNDETKLNNMYYLRDSELSALRPKQSLWPIAVGIGAFVLIGWCIKH